MPDTVVVIEAQLVRLRAARASGVLTIKHGETSTTYRSLAEIERAIAVLEGELRLASTTPRTRVRYPVQLTKGY